MSVLGCKQPTHCIGMWKLIHQGDSWPDTRASSADSTGGNGTPHCW